MSGGATLNMCFICSIHYLRILIFITCLSSVQGFDKKIWNAFIVEDGVCFTYLSKDGEEGYPGLYIRNYFIMLVLLLYCGS